jgi:hypothetical protein
MLRTPSTATHTRPKSGHRESSADDYLASGRRQIRTLLELLLKPDRAHCHVVGSCHCRWQARSGMPLRAGCEERPGWGIDSTSQRNTAPDVSAFVLPERIA